MACVGASPDSVAVGNLMKGILCPCCLVEATLAAERASDEWKGRQTEELGDHSDEAEGFQRFVNETVVDWRGRTITKRDCC